VRGQITPFPATYAAIPLSGLLTVYAAGPGRLRQALHGLGTEELRTRPVPGKWSILEIALHVTDSEVVGAGRIRLALAQPGNSFYSYDQDIWVSTFRHNSGDSGALARGLAALEAIRLWTLPLLAQATAADWERDAIHPEFGPLTVRNLLELYADHVERHIDQILVCRKQLQRPVILPVLLEPRLY